jgi:hypothetical protein
VFEAHSGCRIALDKTDHSDDGAVIPSQKPFRCQLGVACAHRRFMVVKRKCLLPSTLRRASAGIAICNENCYEDRDRCGFGIYRGLTARGHTCWVVPPSNTPRRVRDRIKTDGDTPV